MLYGPAAPALHVWALVHPTSALATPAAQRSLARQRVRALLAQQAGAAQVAALRSAADQPQRAGPVSVSHEPGWSLLAWAAEGCVGIDGVDVVRLAAPPSTDLAATAALYLGPAGLRELQGLYPQADPLLLFAHAWARHEARLKCLGLALQEWSPARQAQLEACAAWPVVWPGALGQGRAVAWLAWRAGPC
jgi:4'-phosphopantetheinyl transferase